MTLSASLRVSSRAELVPCSLFIQDLEGKMIVDELTPAVHSTKGTAPECLSLAWSGDGQTLFAGYSDNLIRVWQVSMAR